MATTPADQQRSILVAAALLASALTIVASRAIQAGRLAGSLLMPYYDLQSL
jgi:hypothetical protein